MVMMKRFRTLINETQITEDKTKSEADEIEMTVPLFIRMLEYAREDAKTDCELHAATEKAVKLHKSGVDCLDMSHFEQLIKAKK